jgi:nucleoside-diphosphate-sugar epimerase
VLPPGAHAVKGDVVSGEGLDEALAGVETAYYLIHSMGRGGQDDFAARDRRAAENFGRAAERAGVRRLIYLGGLSGGEATGSSEHLRSREEVAELLAPHVPELVHARAAMVIGAGGASFEMLRT